MAIKADRQIDSTESRFYLNETAEKGSIVVVSTAGSGVAMDASRNVATVAASASGNYPLGALLTTFVNVDQTRTPVNWHKDEANLGDKAAIMTKGWIVTNKAISATAGADAVLTHSGCVMTKPAIASWNRAANPPVGRFRTGLDENGYATLFVDL